MKRIVFFMITALLFLVYASADDIYNNAGFYSNPAMYGFDDTFIAIRWDQTNNELNTNLFNFLLFSYDFSADVLYYGIPIAVKYPGIPFALGFQFGTMGTALGTYFRVANILQVGLTAHFDDRIKYDALLGIRVFSLFAISGFASIYNDDLEDFSLSSVYYKAILEIKPSESFFIGLSYDKNSIAEFTLNSISEHGGYYANVSTDTKKITYKAGVSLNFFNHKSNVNNRIIVFDFDEIGPTPDVLLKLRSYKDTQSSVFVIVIGKYISSYTDIEDIIPLLKELSKKNYLIGYIAQPTLKALTLASICNEVMMSPADIIDMEGFAASNLFFKNIMNKYGVKAEIFKTGTYKSAYGSFEDENFSESDKEQYMRYFNILLNYSSAIIAKNRKLKEEDIRNAVIEKGFVTSDEAIKAKLVDKLCYSYELIEIAVKKSEKHFGYAPVDIHFPDLSPSFRDMWVPENPIAMLYLTGSIMDEDPQNLQLGSMVITPKRTINLLNEIHYNDYFKGAILIIDSPGGSASASEVIFKKIKELSKDKPVIILQNSVAASGGYYLSLGSKNLFTHQTTLTGSIGVVGMILSFEKLLKDNGITYDEISLGKLATLGLPFKNMTLAEKKAMEEMIQWYLSRFEGAVSEERDISKEEVREVAKGRIWAGEDAVKNKLANDIMTFDRILNLMNQILRVDPNTVRYEIFYPSVIGLESFINSFTGYLLPLQILKNSMRAPDTITTSISYY